MTFAFARHTEHMASALGRWSRGRLTCVPRALVPVPQDARQRVGRQSDGLPLFCSSVDTTLEYDAILQSSSLGVIVEMSKGFSGTTSAKIVLFMLL